MTHSGDNRIAFPHTPGASGVRSSASPPLTKLKPLATAAAA